MKQSVLALMPVTLIASVSLPVIAIGSGAGQAATHAHHPTGPPANIPLTTLPCAFSQPGSLPDPASASATTALDARPTKCPPALPVLP